MLVLVTYGILAAGAGTMLVWGLSVKAVTWTLGGLLGLIVVAATLPVALLLTTLLGRTRETGPLGRMVSELREYSMLSDNAKRVLFRERELQMLRDAIEEDIARGDHNAAITLCDEMANLFGYRQEAEAFRSRAAQAREQQYELEVHAAVEELESSLAEHNWAAVYKQAARLRRLYPESHLVGDLDGRIQQARNEHKHELEARFLEAADQEDVGSAMGLLKQLDRYLNREEAARLSKVAEDVIVRHRDSLGARFRTAVSQHRWGQAVDLGEMIMAEFPNAQMAAEVRSMLEVLRNRAGRPAGAATGDG